MLGVHKNISVLFVFETLTSLRNVAQEDCTLYRLTVFFFFLHKKKMPAME